MLEIIQLVSNLFTIFIGINLFIYLSYELYKYISTYIKFFLVLKDIKKNGNSLLLTTIGINEYKVYEVVDSNNVFILKTHQCINKYDAMKELVKCYKGINQVAHSKSIKVI